MLVVVVEVLEDLAQHLFQAVVAGVLMAQELLMELLIQAVAVVEVVKVVVVVMVAQVFVL